MFVLPEHRPAVMGILNVTPDSFSDGGWFFSRALAVEHAHRMMEEGADLIDIGGESTRPGAQPVSVDEELARVMPVIEALAARGLPLSIDTMKPEVARVAVGAGAVVVNDVNGLRAPGMAETCAELGIPVCIMHMRGEPRTMQANPKYADVVGEVRQFLVEQAEFAISCGVARDRVWIDPGIGFGKTTEHNLALIRGLGAFVETGYPVLVGASRKTFLGRLLGSHEDPLPTSERLEATLAVHSVAQFLGARILRVHDVREARRCVEVLATL